MWTEDGVTTTDTPGDCLRWSPFTGTLSRACQNLFSPLTTITYLHHTPHTRRQLQYAILRKICLNSFNLQQTNDQ